MRRHKPSATAQPVELARQYVDAARNAAQNVDVAEVRSAVAAQAARAAEAAQSIDLNAARDTLTEQVNKDVELVLDETRSRPMRSLLIALGLGTVIGVVLDRASRRKPPEPQPVHVG